MGRLQRELPRLLTRGCEGELFDGRIEGLILGAVACDVSESEFFDGREGRSEPGRYNLRRLRK